MLEQIRYSRIAGKFIYFEGAYNSPESLEQYNRLCAELVTSCTVTASLPSFQERDANDITVIELCDRFLTWADRHYRHADGTKTGADVRHIEACKPLVRLYGRLEVREFSPVKLKTVRQAMIDSGLCRSEVNARIRCIRQFFRWGVENELVPVEVTQALQMVRGLQAGRTTAREAKPIEPVSDDAIRVVLPHLSPIIADMIGVQQLTGMRRVDQLFADRQKLTLRVEGSCSLRFLQARNALTRSEPFHRNPHRRQQYVE